MAKLGALADVIRAAQSALDALATLQAKASTVNLATDDGELAGGLQMWLDSVAGTGDASVCCASLRGQTEWLLNAADQLCQHSAKTVGTETPDSTPATLAESVSAVNAPLQALVAQLGALCARAEATLRTTADRATSVATEIEQGAQTMAAVAEQAASVTRARKEARRAKFDLEEAIDDGATPNHVVALRAACAKTLADLARAEAALRAAQAKSPSALAVRFMPAWKTVAAPGGDTEGAPAVATHAPSCGICVCAYDNGTRKPKVLQCGHTYCEACAGDAAKKGEIQAPKAVQSIHNGHHAHIRPYTCIRKLLIASLQDAQETSAAASADKLVCPGCRSVSNLQRGGDVAALPTTYEVLSIARSQVDK